MAEEAKDAAERTAEATKVQLREAIESNEALVATTKAQATKESDEYEAAKAVWQVALDARQHMLEKESTDLESTKAAQADAQRRVTEEHAELRSLLSATETRLEDASQESNELRRASELSQAAIAKLEKLVESKESEAEILADKVLDLSLIHI